MNGPAYFLVGMALVAASLATVAWCARYQRRPFHPRLPELAFRVLSIASALVGAFVIVVFVGPGQQRGLVVVLLLLVYPAIIQTRRDFGAMRTTGRTEVRRRARRYQQGQQIECGLRIMEGTQPGLGTRFKHGLATLEPGAIRFVPYAGGVRFLPRKPVCVAVVAMDLSDQRSVGWKEALSAKPGLRVIKVRTQMATLECVLPPEQTAWVAQQISPHWPGSATALGLKPA